MGKKRWYKTPPELERELRRLLRETELPAVECLAILGFSKGSMQRVVRECRRYLGNGRWVDLKTGKIKPSICTTVCASKKTGLHPRTIRRRIAAGVIEPAQAVSHLMLNVFSDTDIEKLKEYGKHRGDNKGVLTREDVRLIREAAARGMTHTQIAQSYPVTRTQISRIVSGKRWGDPR